MDRVEFTGAITKLLSCMIEEGERPVLDTVKLPPMVVKAQHQLGETPYDGDVRQSQHQKALAATIFFMDEKLRHVDPIKGWDYWQDQWVLLGGKRASYTRIYAFEAP